MTFSDFLTAVMLLGLGYLIRWTTSEWDDFKYHFSWGVQSVAESTEDHNLLQRFGHLLAKGWLLVALLLFVGFLVISNGSKNDPKQIEYCVGCTITVPTNCPGVNERVTITEEDEDRDSITVGVNSVSPENGKSCKRTIFFEEEATEAPDKTNLSPGGITNEDQ